MRTTALRLTSYIFEPATGRRTRFADLPTISKNSQRLENSIMLFMVEFLVEQVSKEGPELYLSSVP